MKIISIDDLDDIRGRRLGPRDSFRFRCHSALACFNRCCRNLNLFLYPYDVVRLKNRLGIDSDLFIDRYVDVVLRPQSHFPEVLLRMADDSEKTCPFLTDQGCRVYPDRPDTCRTFPVEQGALYNARTDKHSPVYFYRPPEFCLGQHEDLKWTIDSWTDDQDARRYHRMTQRWADIKRRFETNPWGTEGPGGKRAKMAFMAAYNTDRFREFVFQSTFLKRYKVKSALLKKIRRDDAALLAFGFDWIVFFLWGDKSKLLRLRG